MNWLAIIIGALMLLFLIAVIVEPWTPEGRFATMVVLAIFTFLAFGFIAVGLILAGCGLV